MHLDDLVLYDNIQQLVTMKGVAAKRGRHPTEEDLGVIENAAMVVESSNEKILWAGPSADLPSPYQDIVNVFSGEDEVWIPELVDCHTHLVHAGSRHHDYAMRAKGKTYQDIAKEGGGILFTLAHTREASENELMENGNAEIERFQKYGVGVIEVKSGYGLTLDSELRLLGCVRELQRLNTAVLVPTFMPAHATPPEFRGRTDEYVDVICREWIPEVAKSKLAVFFDAFVEEGFFSVAQARKMGEAAASHGFKLKFHCDQFNDIGATPLAVDLKATSADHLDFISPASIEKLAGSETVAVLLPGSSLFMGAPYPPARKLIDAGARVALSTDYNPGTSPTRNLPLMTTLACSQMKMTVPEALAAITYNAAAALSLEDKVGSLQEGKLFRACQLKSQSYEALPYSFGELE